MIFTIFLLAALMQLTFSMPSMQKVREARDAAAPATYCSDVPPGVRKPEPVDCHQIIEYFSQYDPSGWITLDSCIMDSVGSCYGYICNNRDESIRINTGELAYNLTVNLFDPCILAGRDAYWNGGDYYAVMGGVTG
ncbi:hypothetical protein VTK26DRAFT_6166 [Humicola hyalothermophila]